MVSNRIGAGVVLTLLLVLPISALAARRLRGGTVIKYALAWAAIFAAAITIVLLIQRGSGS